MSAKLRCEVGKMENSRVRKHHSVTARTDRVVRRDVTGSVWTFKSERSLKWILLSSAMGVLGACAFAGTSGGSLDSAAATTQSTGLATSQMEDKCLEVPPSLVPPWDLACLLERPVGALSSGPQSGNDDRGGRSGDDGGGPGDSGPGDDGTGDDGTGDDGTGDDTTGDDTASNNAASNGTASDHTDSEHTANERAASDHNGRDRNTSQ